MQWRPPREPRTITVEQAEAFQHDGFFVMENVFSATELAELDEALEPGNERVAELLAQLPDGRISVAGVDTQLVTPNQVGATGVLIDTCRHRTLAGVCADLVGPDVRLYWEQAVYKQPRSVAPVLWHQDNGYTYVEPQAYLTCWIAITDATRDNGCVRVAPGVHREGTLVHRSTEFGQECWGDESGAVEVPVPAGDVVVFSSLTPHTTGVNRTDDVRKSYIVQYTPDGAEVLEGAPPAAPTRRRRLDDPVLNAWVVRDGEPVDG